MLVLFLKQLFCKKISESITNIGFMNRCQTSDNIRLLVDLLSLCADRNKTAILASLDIEKAFDMVKINFLIYCIQYIYCIFLNTVSALKTGFHAEFISGIKHYSISLLQ